MKRAAQPIAAALLVAAVVAAIAWRVGFGGELRAPSRVERGDPKEEALREPPASPAANDEGTDVATPSEPPALAAARELLVEAPISVTTVDVDGNSVGGVALRLAPTLSSLRDEATDLAHFATDAAGRATLARAVVANRGGFCLLARCEGFVPDCRCVAVPPLLESGELRVTLERRATFVVEVVDPRERPVAGAEVTFVGPRGLEAQSRLGDAVALVEGGLLSHGTTDATGAVALPTGQAVGVYIQIHAPPWHGESFRVSTDERKARRKRVQLAEVVVAGWRVVDASSGRASRRSRGGCRIRVDLTKGPIEELPIGLESNPEKIEAAVRARLADPEVDLLVSLRRRDDEAAAAVEIGIAADPGAPFQAYPLRFVAADDFGDDDVLLVRSSRGEDELAELTVAFVDAAGQPALPVFHWFLERDGGSRASPAQTRDGRVAFVVPAGAYRLRAYPDPVDGRGFDPRSLELNPGTRQELIVAIDRPLPSAALRARAFDVTGEPLEHWVLVVRYARGSMPLFEGAGDPFVRSVERLPTGRITLTAHLGTAAPPQTLELDLAAGETREVEFRLR